jgi:hypothetical protein
VAEALVVLVMFGTFAVIVWGSAAAAEAVERRRDVLTELAGKLGGVSTGASVLGRVRERRVSVRYTTRGEGSWSEAWTQVDAELPSTFPLELIVAARRGFASDARLPAPDFHATFLVDGAPRSIVSELLDSRLRQLLMSLHAQQVELETIAGTLRLSIRGWLEDANALAAMCDALAHVCRRVGDVYAAVVPPVHVMSNTPFREDPRKVVVLPTKEHVREVAELRAALRDRPRRCG